MINQGTKSLLVLLALSASSMASSTTIVINTNACLNKFHYNKGVHTAVHHRHRYATHATKVVRKPIIVVRPPIVRPIKRTIQVR